MSGKKTALISVFSLAVLVLLANRAAGEEVALLNHLGAGVAYIDTEEDSTIYLWNGVPVAYLEGEVIYGFNGRHLGWFEEGIVRGGRGKRVGYTEETIGSVGRTARVTRVKGVKQPKLPPVPPTPPLPKPPYTDIDSPVPLGELLRLGMP
jgi:hypothetical protein